MSSRELQLTDLRAESFSQDAHYNLANRLVNMPGHGSEAINEYEAALRIDPNYAAAHYGLGIALSTSGRRSEAIAHMEAALALRPDAIEARQALARLRSADP